MAKKRKPKIKNKKVKRKNLKKGDEVDYDYGVFEILSRNGDLLTLISWADNLVTYKPVDVREVEFSERI